MTDPALPRRVPRPKAEAFRDADARRFVAACQSDAYRSFQALQAQLVALADRPEAEILLDSSPENEILGCARALSQAVASLRWWRGATSPDAPYAQLHRARQKAFELLAAADDPTRPDAQSLERVCARQFLADSGDGQISLFLQEEALASV